MSESITNLSAETFENEINSADKPVLVDFWADWCQPCRMIAPSVKQIAEEYDGRVKVGKLDVDTNSNLSMTYGIRGIPALLIFENGKPVDQIVGAVPKSVLQDRIESTLA